MIHAPQATPPTPELVAHSIITPRRVSSESMSDPALHDGVRHIPIGTEHVAVRIAGTGPLVLLVHGWEGQGSDMFAYEKILLTQGFSVAIVDLPAHGSSTGKQATIPEGASALLAIEKELGSIYGAIAHSVGAVVLVESMHRGLKVPRVVFIAPPNRFEDQVKKIALLAGLDHEGTVSLLAILSSKLGMDLGELTFANRAQLRSEAALFLHSENDRLVNIQESLASSSAWKGSQHIRFDDLGHRRILSDPLAVQAAIQFITQNGD